jgi:hypothetical protein
MPWLIRRPHRAPITARLSDALSVATIALVIGGCGSSMQVATDFDRAANFAPLKTYSWRDGTKLPNPLMSERVVAAVDANLKAKGLTRVDSGGDITVTYHASADKSVDVQSFSTGSPYGCWGGCYSGSMTSTTVTPVTTGTLVVDLVDTKSNKMLWRGTASDTVSGDPKENEQKINEGIGRMFENYPPKQK